MSATFEQNAEFLAVAAREAREEAQPSAGAPRNPHRRPFRQGPGAGLDLRRSAVEFLASAGDSQARRGETRPVRGGAGAERSAPAKWSPC